MRKIAVSLALATTALASPALARDNSFYVGADGGGMIVEDIDYDIGALPSAATVNHEYGWDLDANIGYDFGFFRVETEVGYRKALVDSYSSTTTTPAFAAGGGLANAPAGNYDYAGRYSSALSFMLNGLLDFGPDDGIQGFVGGGVGVARVKANYALNTNGDFLNDSDTRFAYQGLAGVRAPLTDHLDAVVKYRFFTAPNARFVDTTSRNFEGRFRSHSILGGISYNFGTPTPPPPPAPAPRTLHAAARARRAAGSGSAVLARSVHRVLRMGQVGRHARGSVDPRQCRHPVSVVRQCAGHAGGLHRHVGSDHV